MAEHVVKKTFGEVIKEYGLVTVGLLAYSLGWTIFLLPNNLVGGGVSGFVSRWDIPTLSSMPFCY